MYNTRGVDKGGGGDTTSFLIIIGGGGGEMALEMPLHEIKCCTSLSISLITRPHCIRPHYTPFTLITFN